MIIAAQRLSIRPLALRAWAALVLVLLLLSPAPLLAQHGDYSGHEETDTGLTVIAGSDTLVFSVYAPDVLRVDFLPNGARGPDSTYAVIRAPSDAVPFNVSDRTSYLELETSDFTLRIDKFPVRLTYYDARGEELLADPASGGFEAPGTSRRANFELPAV